MSQFTRQHFDLEAPSFDPFVQGTSSCCPSIRRAYGLSFADEKETDLDNRRDGRSIPTGSSAEESPENTVVEDFDDSANALWSLYAKEAKSHDEATVETIKDDMDGALIRAFIYFLSTLGLVVMTDDLIRLACFLVSSPHFSSIVIRTYNSILRNSRHTSSNNLLCCLTKYPPSFRLSARSSLPIYLFRTLRFGHHHLTSG